MIAHSGCLKMPFFGSLLSIRAELCDEHSSSGKTILG